MVHKYSTNLDLHLNPVEDSTSNVISILICGENAQWYVKNPIALVIVQHVIQFIQMCITCQKMQYVIQRICALCAECTSAVAPLNVTKIYVPENIRQVI